MKINYDIEKIKVKINMFKYKYIYVVYKNIVSDCAIGCRKLFEGSYNNCKMYCIQNNINLKEVIYK